MPFRPGLVGGHCIGVAPYYLTHKAQEVGYHSEVILAGRRINDSMAGHVADQLIKLMLRKNLPVLGSKVLAMPAPGQYAAVVLAVGHHQFAALGESGLKALGQPGAVLFDVKSIMPLGEADGRL